MKQKSVTMQASCQAKRFKCIVVHMFISWKSIGKLGINEMLNDISVKYQG